MTAADEPFVPEPDYALWIGPPPNPRVGRQRVLVGFLRLALVLAVLDAVVTLVVPDDIRPAAGRLMVVLLVGTPLVRVAWLVVRWARLGDRRYAAVGVLLLAIVGVAMVVAL